MFDYTITFPVGSDTIILIAPNGYGKTAFLSLLNSCLRLQLNEASEHSFTSLDVVFEDNSKWSFTKIQTTTDEPPDWIYERNIRAHGRRPRRRQSLVKVEYYDPRGRLRKGKDVLGFESIPPEILASAVERVLPVSRESFDTFHDYRRDELLRLPQLLERYKQELLLDSDFKEYISRFDPSLFQQLGNHVNCVFIETQRLLYNKKARSKPDSPNEPEEEILRQSQHLAMLLQRTYAQYAATSQSLDRSFPNSLFQ